MRPLHCIIISFSVLGMLVSKNRFGSKAMSKSHDLIVYCQDCTFQEVNVKTGRSALLYSIHQQKGSSDPCTHDTSVQKRDTKES